MGDEDRVKSTNGVRFRVLGPEVDGLTCVGLVILKVPGFTIGFGARFRVLGPAVALANVLTCADLVVLEVPGSTIGSVTSRDSVILVCLEL
jgi:hypothetical protein